MAIPRPEYPRPQFERKDWLCLNGDWAFAIDPGDSGLQRGMLDRVPAGVITIPFCPESRLSGIEHTDFIAAVWYRREVVVPPEWAGRRVLLHFQAVDYDATVWCNGVQVGRHRGGFTPFTCDLDGAVRPGERACIVVRAREPWNEPRPGGKQNNFRYANFGCMYTRMTGIWQTVWMEPVPDVCLRRPRVTPDVAGRRFVVEQPVSQNRRGLRVRAVLSDDRGECARAEAPADGDFTPRLHLELPKDRVRLWGPGAGHLYGLRLELLDAAGTVVDAADSYAGLRSVTIDGGLVRINGQVVFQRLVLDQGWYPDGLLTAPSDEALQRDIHLSMEAGFNGARLHQKVFEERFLYHADRMGYLVWGEFGDWGFRRGMGVPTAYVADGRIHQPAASLMAQWLEVLERDYSHPAIIGWCPLNESAEEIGEGISALDDVTHGLFLATKAADGTRPVLDASGYSHREPRSDVWDSHDYDQNPASFRERHDGLLRGQPHANGPSDRPWSLPWRGQPFFVSEFGGIWWNPEVAAGTDSWGYGDRPATEEAFHARFAGLCAALLENPRMFGYCYTQLTDVFQEQNGIYHFDRRAKFDPARLRAVQSRRAACEASDA